jgi:hypothetical protein
MKRLLLAGALAAVAAVPAAACSPLNCAPSQFALSHGLLAVRAGGIDANVRVLDLRDGRTRWWLPPGVLAGDVLIHQDGTLLTWLNAVSGTRLASAVTGLRGRYSLVGSSLDGRRAVLARTERQDVVRHRRAGGRHATHRPR